MFNAIFNKILIIWYQTVSFVSLMYFKVFGLSEIEFHNRN